MRRTRTPPLLPPPILYAFLYQTHVSLILTPTIPSPKENTHTYLMELTPTNQPRHPNPRLILLKANHTLLLLPLRIHAILLRRRKRKHTPSRMCHSTTLPTSSCIAHAARALRR
jgi:hypothetical protein